MGASVSTATSATTNDIITTSVNQCPKTSASNQLSVNNLTIPPNPACGTGTNPAQTLNIAQAAAVDAQCYITALQNNTASTIATLNANAQAGLGIAVSTDVASINNNLKANIQNTCKNVSTSNAISINDSLIAACTTTIAQNANANSMCQINALQTTAIQAQTSATSTATGASLSSLLGIGISSTIIIIIIIVVIYYFWSSKKSSSNSDEGDDDESRGGAGSDFFNKKNYSITIIMILLILVVVFVAFSTTSSSKLTMPDLANFQSKVAEANKIAKLDESSETKSDDRSYPNYDSYIRQTINPIPQNIFTQPYMTNNQSYYNNLNAYYEPLI